MKKFQYTAFMTVAGVSPVKELNKLGEQGWQLVETTELDVGYSEKRVQYILIREIKD